MSPLALAALALVAGAISAAAGVAVVLADRRNRRADQETK